MEIESKGTDQKEQTMTTTTTITITTTDEALAVNANRWDATDAQIDAAIQYLTALDQAREMIQTRALNTLWDERGARIISRKRHGYTN